MNKTKWIATQTTNITTSTATIVASQQQQRQRQRQLLPQQQQTATWVTGKNNNNNNSSTINCIELYCALKRVRENAKRAREGATLSYVTRLRRSWAASKLLIHFVCAAGSSPEKVFAACFVYCVFVFVFIVFVFAVRRYPRLVCRSNSTFAFGWGRSLVKKGKQKSHI